MVVRRRVTGWLLALGLAGSVSLLAQPDDPGVLVQAQFADLLFGDARYRDAIDFYERAYAGSVGDLRTSMGRGLVKSLLRSAEFKRARVAAAALVDEAPEDAEALALLGDARWSAGQFDGAEQAYGESLARRPEQARALNGMARGFDSRGRPDEALDYARRAVAAGPREPEFHHTLGFVLQRQRRYPEAALAYTNYSNLLPNKDSSEIAAWARQQITFLRSFGDRQPLAVKSGTEGVVHTVPFKVRNNKIVVSGKVNGRGEMDFVLDTGSEMTVVSKRTAQRQGIAPVVYTLSAGVGGVGLRGLMVGTMERLPGRHARRRPGADPDQESATGGIADPGGRELLADRVRLLGAYRLHAPSHHHGARPSAADADFVLPLRVHRLAMITGHVNGATAVPFVLDTGGEVVSISRSTADAINVVPRRRIGLLVYGTSGWTRRRSC